MVRWGDTAPEIGTEVDRRNWWGLVLEELILTVLAHGPMKWQAICEVGKREEHAGPDPMRRARDRLLARGLIRKRRIGGGPGVGWWWCRPEHWGQIPEIAGAPVT